MIPTTFRLALQIPAIAFVDPLGLSRTLAGCFDDQRQPVFVDPSLPQLLAQIRNAFLRFATATSTSIGEVTRNTRLLEDLAQPAVHPHQTPVT